MDGQKMELLPEVKLGLENIANRDALIEEQHLICDIGAEAEGGIKTRSEDERAIVRRRAASEIGAVKQAESSRVNDLQADIDGLTEAIKAVRRKAAFLAAKDEIEADKVEFDDETMKPYRGKEMLRLGTYYEDRYLIVKLYIVENDRPKNRYTLIAFGYSPLSEFLEYRTYYGGPVMYHGPRPTFAREIAHKPTPEDLKEFLKKRTTDKIIPQLGRYLKVRDEYIETIANHTIKEFRPMLEPPIVSDEDAPVVFRITRYDKTQEYRLHHGLYYIEVGKDEEVNVIDHIKVNGKVYKELCRPERLSITQHGNTTFGDWWSIDIDTGISGPVFYRPNWERELAKAQAYVDEQNAIRKTANKEAKLVVLSKSDVEWVTPMSQVYFDRQLTRAQLGIPGPDVIGIGTTQRFHAIMAIAESHFDGDDSVDTGQVLEDLETIINICNKALK